MVLAARMPDQPHTRPTVHRILVVDNNKVYADAAGSLLRLLGHTVEQAYDGLEALRIAQEFKPDAVFLDLVMPEMDGVELASALRDLDCMKGVKIILLTAFRQQASSDAVRAAGFNAIVAKPASADDLAKALAGK
jgi:CheY-like chemotaxis protein